MLKVLLAIFVGLIIVKTFCNPIIAYKQIKRLRNFKKIFGHKLIGLYKIEYVRILVFIKLFSNALTMVFLPQFMLQITLQSHMSPSFASVLYVFYQIIFILMLIPGGYLVEVRHLKKLLILVTCMEGIALSCYGLASQYWEILVLQMAFGILVPISSATEYAYLFRLSSRTNRAYVISLYNNSARGAIIAGVFCGGILAHLIGNKNTFFVASALEYVAVIFALFFIPVLKTSYKISVKHSLLSNFSFKFVLQKIPTILADVSALKTLLFVGIPIGLLEDGVVLFSIPLMLNHYGISKEIIGQLLVIFSIGFFITNKYITQKADKLKSENVFMALGLSGFSLGLILLSYLQTYGFTFIALGLLLLGMARGFVLSPTISYLTKNKVFVTMGKNVGVAMYRISETLGRILGPILVMQVLLFYQFRSIAFALMSIFFLCVTLLFFLGIRKT